MTLNINNNLLKKNNNIINSLREKIRRIENKEIEVIPSSLGKHKYNKAILPKVISLDFQQIDPALPWHGLPISGLHEIYGDVISGIGFSTALIVKASKIYEEKNIRPQILWCQKEDDLCAQGFYEFGMDPNNLIIAKCANSNDVLWAMEEGLRSNCLTAVVGKIDKISSIAGKRLQLASENAATMGILIRNSLNNSFSGNSPTLTKWRVNPSPNFQNTNIWTNHPRWNLELQKYKLSMAFGEKLKNAGEPKSWLVEWNNETSNLSVVTNISGRPNRTQSNWTVAV